MRFAIETKAKMIILVIVIIDEVDIPIRMTLTK